MKVVSFKNHSKNILKEEVEVSMAEVTELSESLVACLLVIKILNKSLNKVQFLNVPFPLPSIPKANKSFTPDILTIFKNEIKAINDIKIQVLSQLKIISITMNTPAYYERLRVTANDETLKMFFQRIANSVLSDPFFGVQKGTSLNNLAYYIRSEVEGRENYGIIDALTLDPRKFSVKISPTPTLAVDTDKEWFQSSLTTAVDTINAKILNPRFKYLMFRGSTNASSEFIKEFSSFTDVVEVLFSKLKVLFSENQKLESGLRTSMNKMNINSWTPADVWAVEVGMFNKIMKAGKEIVVSANQLMNEKNKPAIKRMKELHYIEGLIEKLGMKVDVKDEADNITTSIDIQGWFEDRFRNGEIVGISLKKTTNPSAVLEVFNTTVMSDNEFVITKSKGIDDVEYDEEKTIHSNFGKNKGKSYFSKKMMVLNFKVIISDEGQNPHSEDFRLQLRPFNAGDDVIGEVEGKEAMAGKVSITVIKTVFQNAGHSLQKNGWRDYKDFKAEIMTEIGSFDKLFKLSGTTKEDFDFSYKKMGSSNSPYKKFSKLIVGYIVEFFQKYDEINGGKSTSLDKIKTEHDFLLQQLIEMCTKTVINRVVRGVEKYRDENGELKMEMLYNKAVIDALNYLTCNMQNIVIINTLKKIKKKEEKDKILEKIYHYASAQGFRLNDMKNQQELITVFESLPFVKVH